MCREQAIAIDIGTSGIRGQLLDLGSGKVVRTYVTTRNPVPGSNVMDHLSFAIERGPGLARGILLDAVHGLVAGLSPERLVRIGVCGNPIQLSLFSGTEVRDLAYAGKNMLSSQNVGEVDRSGRIVPGDTIGLAHDIEVIIPPAVRHEIGADALAMMLKSGFLDDDMCMVTDYGTNAEMALKVGDDIYSGSAAAGPALEGQQISSGMLAGPGALCDLVRTPRGWRAKVLDRDLVARDGPLLNLRSGISRAEGMVPTGITGTGVVALVYAGMQDGRIEPPEIRGGPIEMSRRIRFGEEDLKEAGKAIGAIRAGHMSLIAAAGIDGGDVSVMYMAGASGTYVDPVKAQAVGIVPAGAGRLVQVGNTSLALAKDLALDPDMIKPLNDLRGRLLTKHIMFAEDDMFRNLYVCELAHWTEGMSERRYSKAVEDLGIVLPSGPPSGPTVERRVVRDIDDVGEGMTVADCGTSMHASWECSGCMTCVRSCPEDALVFEDGMFRIDTGRCLGTACCRCQEGCPEKIFYQGSFSLGRGPGIIHPDRPCC